MKVVFFGSPASALPSLNALLKAGHEVRLVVTQPDKPAGRGKKLTPPPVKIFALDHGLEIIQPEKIRKDEQALERIKKAEPDVTGPTGR
ncbi:MAG: hypothetical protein H5U07_05260 [Candidatus Aminicenantes bacterium]|nr:hypothetical protein [Candidatus Aminicenantes bacterium]